MNLLDTARQRVSLTAEGNSEWHGPCPKCGGENRFYVRMEPDGRQHWDCRQCRANGAKVGDLIAFFRWFDGLSYQDAKRQAEGGGAVEGCTLERWAERRRLPETFVRKAGASEIFYVDRPAVRFPFIDREGNVSTSQYFIAPSGPDSKRFKKGGKVIAYGLQWLDEAREAGEITIVEGVPDTLTLRYHGIPAIGLPSASYRADELADALEGIENVYAVAEPDAGGESVRRSLRKSRLAGRVRLIPMSAAHKDPSALHAGDPAAFRERWAALKADATKLADEVRAEAKASASTAWRKCRRLAEAPDILAELEKALPRAGLTGEVRAAKVVFLVVVSRFLARVLALAVKGPSSCGKSFLVETVLRFFPAAAFYALSSMSERALAYSEEPVSHRILVIYEAAGLTGDFASYLVRSLLSEGCIRYETVEKTKDGMKPRLIERTGPTGLIVTTTAVHLHPENETRIISIPVTDTRDQTRLVLLSLADEGREELDFTPWHALHEWLSSAEHRVTIPYSRQLAELIPPVAVRLRRDFVAILNLIRAHAILHQANRQRDAQGRIVADRRDYSAIRELVADLVSEGVEASVAPSVRETVEAVCSLVVADEPVPVVSVARALKVDKSTALRRVRVAVDRGYLRNLEERKGKPARLLPGESLPEQAEILPLPEALETIEDSEDLGAWCSDIEEAA